MESRESGWAFPVRSLLPAIAGFHPAGFPLGQPGAALRPSQCLRSMGVFAIVSLELFCRSGWDALQHVSKMLFNAYISL